MNKRTKLKVNMLTNGGEFSYRMSKGQFSCYSRRFRYFVIFNFSPFLGRSEPGLRYFSRSLWKWHPKMNQTTKSQNSYFYFFTSWPRMILTWHEVTNSILMCVDVSQTQSMPVHRFCFGLTRLPCLAKPAKGRQILKSWLLPWSMTSSVTFR